MLKFTFHEVQQEGVAFNQLVKPYIRKAEYDRLSEFLRELENFRRSKMQRWRWEIRRHRPITTIVSKGGLDPDAHGEDVFGRFSCAWDIQRIDAREFLVYGLASCSLKIFIDDGKVRNDEEEHNREPFLHWNMDLATEATAPGCYVHSQIFEKKVPRFPGVALTPFSAFEFLVGEIFHDRWTETVGSGGSGPSWRSVQRTRMIEYIDWLRHKISTNATSPWMALKGARPEDGAFQMK